MSRVQEKDVSDRLDFGFRLTPWLQEKQLDPSTGVVLVPGELIDTVSWTVPTGLSGDSDDHNGYSCWIFLSGGTANERYRITADIVTTQNRHIQKTMVLDVYDK